MIEIIETKTINTKEGQLFQIVYKEGDKVNTAPLFKIIDNKIVGV